MQEEKDRSIYLRLNKTYERKPIFKSRYSKPLSTGLMINMEIGDYVCVHSIIPMLRLLLHFNNSLLLDNFQQILIIAIN